MFEQDEVHGDGGGHEMKMIKLNLEKKKEKNKKPRRSRQRYMIGFLFCTQDTIEGVSDLGSIAVL